MLACAEYGLPRSRLRAASRYVALMVDDLAAERRSLVGVFGGFVQRGLRQPDGDGGDAQPAGIQCAEGDLQTLPLVADATVGVDVRVVVEGRRRGHRVQAHLLLGLAEAQAGQIAGDEEAGDTAGAFPSTGEQCVEIGPPAVGDPRLRSVDDVAVVGLGGRTPQRGRVRTGLWFGEAVGADLLTRQHAGQPPLLLLLAAEGQQRVRREAVHADRDRDRRPPRRDLLEHLQVHLVRLAAAAPLLGLRQAQQPGGTELREHPIRIGLRLLVRVDDGVEHLVGDVAGEGDQVLRLLRRK